MRNLMASKNKALILNFLKKKKKTRRKKNNNNNNLTIRKD